MTEDERERVRAVTKALLEREAAHIKSMSPADGVRACGLIENATGRKLSEAEVEQVARRMEAVLDRAGLKLVPKDVVPPVCPKHNRALDRNGSCDSCISSDLLG